HEQGCEPGVVECSSDVPVSRAVSAAAAPVREDHDRIQVRRQGEITVEDDAVGADPDRPGRHRFHTGVSSRTKMFAAVGPMPLTSCARAAMSWLMRAPNSLHATSDRKTVESLALLRSMPSSAGPMRFLAICRTVPLVIYPLRKPEQMVRYSCER